MLHNAGLFHLNGLSVFGILNIHPQSIAGLLSRNPLPFVINGSLWTLPFEFGCYLAVAVFAACGIIRRGRIAVLAVFAALWALYTYNDLCPASFARSLPYPGIELLIPLCLFFTAGSVCFLYREKIQCSAFATVGCIALLVVSLPLDLFGVVAPMCMSYTLFWAGV